MDWRQLKPKKTKFLSTLKMQKGKLNLKKTTNGLSKLKSGIIGLKAMEAGRIKGKELGSCLIYLRRKLKKLGTATLRTFPDISISKKPLESRLGGGKGSVEHWGVRVRPDSIILELNIIPRLRYYISNSVTQLLEKTLLKVSTKLSVKTKLVYKLDPLHTLNISSSTTSDIDLKDQKDIKNIEQFVPIVKEQNIKEQNIKEQNINDQKINEHFLRTTGKFKNFYF